MPKVLTVGVTPTNYEGRAIFLDTSNLLSFQLGRSVAAMLANLNSGDFILLANTSLREVDLPVFLLKSHQC